MLCSCVSVSVCDCVGAHQLAGSVRVRMSVHVDLHGQAHVDVYMYMHVHCLY